MIRLGSAGVARCLVALVSGRQFLSRTLWLTSRLRRSSEIPAADQPSKGVGMVSRNLLRINVALGPFLLCAGVEISKFSL